MADVQRSALVPYSAEQMYDLVADVDAYPEFLPGCRAVTVHERDEDRVRATIDISRGPVHRAFTTVNHLTPKSRMDLSLVEGPFKELEGQWRFEDLGEAGSKVSLSMHYEFSSRLLAMTLGPVFDDVAGHLVDAFIERARKAYAQA